MRAGLAGWVVGAAMVGSSLTIGEVRSQAIEFSSGGGDLTFYYESATDTWYNVFRQKGSTSATGLTSPFAGFPNIVGYEAANDFNFSTLQVNVSSPVSQTVGALSYWITPASGSSIFPTTTANPDLGIRTRLRENPGSVDQFDDLDLELDWGASTKPVGAEFVMFNTDGVGNVQDILFNTANADFAVEFSAYGHSHWHYGFTTPGVYNLVFDYDGHGGLHGATASGGSVEIQFNVIPEPGVVGLALLGIGAILWSKRRRIIGA